MESQPQLLLDGTDNDSEHENQPLLWNVPYFHFIARRTHIDHNLFTDLNLIVLAFAHNAALHLVPPVKMRKNLPKATIPVVFACRNNNWNVTYIGNRHPQYFGTGWRDFVQENDMKIGDGCLLELVECSSEGAKFRVQILDGITSSNLELKCDLGYKSIDLERGLPSLEIRWICERGPVNIQLSSSKDFTSLIQFRRSMEPKSRVRLILLALILQIGGVLGSDLQCKKLPETLTSTIGLSSLQHDLIGEGSHRRLHTSLKLHTEREKIASELSKHVCRVVAVQRLPNGVFADPFELQHLVQRRVVGDAVVHGDKNLELPSALSGSSIVEIDMEVGSDALSSGESEFEVEIKLPLHARYPPLDSSGYSSVEIGVPDLFMHCSVEEMSERESCLWMISNSTAPSRAANVLWRIPSGNKAHSMIVSAVTFFTALLCTLLILMATLNKSSALNSQGMAKQE
ncbi:hypothetical protein Syun_018131 [Stephania yunnanensis]|uniref:TF-B3 domain-containing protein n=1 Tax=Stephania yunnanensis TaxID=152371 RepID=A0AAP0IRT6_9MAGN